MHNPRTLASLPALSFSTEAIWFTGIVDMPLAPVRKLIFLDKLDSIVLMDARGGIQTKMS